MAISSKRSAIRQASASSAIALTWLDLQKLCEQVPEAGGCPQTAFETRWKLPSLLGDGGDRLIHLRGGLTLNICHATLWQPLQIEQHHKPAFPLTAKFYLSGSSRVQTRGTTEIQADYAEIAGCNYLYYLPNLTEVEEWQSDEAIQVVMVYASADYFQAFQLNEAVLAQPLQRLLNGDTAQRFHLPLGQTTAAMNQVLQQILHAPYRGMTQQLYLESKALELVALQFGQWSDAPPSSGRSQRLRSDELERLHAAKEILIHNISNPPALAEIAQQVELPEYKLKQNFQRVFGTTPFGYLHHHRMQLAQQLLLNSNLSIAGVAAKVGYCNPEAFSTAFRRKFAISPKAYQLGKHN